MKSSEFIFESPQADQAALSVLMFLRKSAIERGLQPKISTNHFLSLVRNSGQEMYEYEDFVNANKSDPAIKELVKSYSKESIELDNGEDDDDDDDDELESSKQVDSRKVVKNLAKKALKRDKLK